MQLGIMDRFGILSVLPEHGNIVTLRLVHELRQRVGFSAVELQEYEITQGGHGQVSWNPQKEVAKDFEFALAEKAIITAGLLALNEQQQLQTIHLNIFALFVEDVNAGHA